MGLEAKCRVTFRNETREARVHLDSKKIDIYLKPALHIEFSDLRGVAAEDGELRMKFDGSSLILQLGAAAERWAAKIKNPKGRLDKLGVKAGDQRVVLLGDHDPEFEIELLERIDKLYRKPTAGADLVFLFLRASTVNDLGKLKSLRATLAPQGAIWVVREKGKAAPVREAEVREAAKAAGLVDVKVVAFSETLTADKFVVPIAGR